MKKVQLITDGACLGNPGPGGWAYILKYGDRTREMFGSEPQTTNNRMELTAAVRGLDALKEPCEVEIVAHVPTSEVLRYAIDLRSMTGGRGRFTREHSHYDPVPSHLTDKIVATAKAAKA